MKEFFSSNWFIGYCIGFVLCFLIGLVQSFPDLKKGYIKESILSTLILSIFSWITLIFICIAWISEKRNHRNENLI